MYVSHRPYIGNVTAYVYYTPPENCCVEEALNLARSVGAVRLRLYSVTPIHRLARYEIGEPKTLVVDIGVDEESLWDSIGPKTRNMIRRAEKNGVSVRATRGQQDFVDWWRIYSNLAERAGFDTQNQDLVYSLLVESALTRLFVSEKESRIIGGSYFLINEYPMYWLGAVDRQYGSDAPGHVNIWRALIGFADEGFPIVDLGGIDPDEEGSTRFKKSFSRDLRSAYLYQVPLGGMKQKLLGRFLR